MNDDYNILTNDGWKKDINYDSKLACLKSSNLRRN